jgi:hypothetical protein
MGKGSFALGKGQNVRGLVLSSIYSVELLDRLVPGQNDRQLGVPLPKSVEHGPRTALHLGARHAFVRPFLHREPHRHRVNLA